MTTSRLTDSQIIAILKQADAGSPVPELCRKHGISNATFYKWRSKFNGVDASLMARMNELQNENRRLKNTYVEECLKAELVAEALKKHGSVGLAAEAGAMGRFKAVSHTQAGVTGIWHQQNLLPLPG